MISFQDDAIPICGLAKSSSLKPTARSIPLAGARSIPSVTKPDLGFILFGGFFSLMGLVYCPKCFSNSSRTLAASAWPPVNFITAPIRAPAAGILPPRTFSAVSGAAAIASSIAFIS